MRRVYRSVWLVCLLVGIVVVAVPSGVLAAKPLTEKGLLRLIELGTDEAKLIANIGKNGTDFEANDDALKRLKDAGASDAVLQAVRDNAKKAGAPAGKAAKAVALDDVVELLENGADESTILSLLQKSPTLFTLGAADEARLRKAGATDRLIDAMKGNRTKADQQGDVTDFAVILDCSGSMMERTKDGQTKIDAAKRVVTDLVQKIPVGLRLTFIIYGHQREDSCTAIKIVRPLSEIDSAAKSELAQLIDKLHPVGATPIALSLKVAGRELAKNDAFCGMVLISDGKESCNGNPAAEAAELAKNPKLSFGVNVIGFDVRDDERRSLEQIAEKGKGKYYNADSAAKLQEAVAALRKELESRARTAPEQRGSREVAMSGKAGKPGAFLHQAGPVTPGEYKGSLAMMEAHYYKIAVRKGQELRVIGQIQKSPYEAQNHHNNQTFSITIYDSGLAVAKREAVTVQDTPKTVQTVRATWNAASDGVAYIAIAASDNTDGSLDPVGLYPDDFKPKPSPYTLRVRLEPPSSESAGPAEVPVGATRAGNGFGQAGELALPSMVGADIKLGEVAFYKAQVKKGQKLRVSAAAQKPWYNAENRTIRATYTLTAYDDDQVQIAQIKLDVNSNPPDAKSLSLNLTAPLDGKVYVSVSCENTGQPVYPKTFEPKPGFLVVHMGPAAGDADGSK